jgi:hypothetical protein
MKSEVSPLWSILLWSKEDELLVYVMLHESSFFSTIKSNTAFCIRGLIRLCRVAREYFFGTTESNTAFYPRPIENGFDNGVLEKRVPLRIVLTLFLYSLNLYSSPS